MAEKQGNIKLKVSLNLNQSFIKKEYSDRDYTISYISFDIFGNK